MKSQNKKFDKIDTMLFDYFKENTNIPKDTENLQNNIKYTKHKTHFSINKVAIILITLSTLTAGIILSINNSEITKNVNKEIQSTSDQKGNDKKIFGEMVVGEGMPANDITIPENLINENYTSIVKVVVKEVSNESHIIPPTEEYYNPYVGYKSVNVDVTEVMYGDKQLIGNNTFYMTGGLVKVSEVEKYIDEEEKIKIGISKLSQQEKDEYYIDYTVEHDFELVPGEEYVLFLAKQTKNLYFIDAEGLGIFKEVKDSRATYSSTRTYKNVLTGNIFSK